MPKISEVIPECESDMMSAKCHEGRKILLISKRSLGSVGIIFAKKRAGGFYDSE
jgi:hypothetical protein